MKRELLKVLMGIVIIFGIAGCSSKGDGGGGGGGGTSEANLVVTLNPPVGTTQPAAPGDNFPLTVSITSAIPTQGVTIDVKAAPDGSTTNFFTESRSSTSANNNFTITGTPVNVVCVTTVTVTSKSKPSNTWTGSYRYSRKP